MKRLALIALLLLPAYAVAETDPGAAAFERGDFETAYKIWRPLAERGNAELQMRIGSMHEWGRGVRHSFSDAVRWYRQAAEQGHAEAQFTLGFMYSAGRGVPQDHVQAYIWYSLAAAQGDEDARDFLDATRERMGREEFVQAEHTIRELASRR